MGMDAAAGAELGVVLDLFFADVATADHGSRLLTGMEWCRPYIEIVRL
jgi:hypothetical protein